MNQSSRYFSLVGWLIGSITALALWGASLILPVSVAVIISMLVSIFLTGAFHEDGLADSADGLGGGMTLAKKLAIMKDSRIGTYGAIRITSYNVCYTKLLRGLEAIFTILALRDQIVPATRNLTHKDPAADGVDIVAGSARKMSIEYAISNGFGFGGVNASVLFKRWD